MKKIYIPILFVLLSQLIFAQFPFTGFGCANLEINNWRVQINANNSNFWDMIGEPKAEIPKGSGKMTIFCQNFWIGGYDGNNDLHMSADRYYANGGCFTPGPTANSYDSLFYNKYNRVWEITESEVTNHMNNWSNGGYVMPEVIENWPGNGDISNGEAPVLAPFIDANNNGIYDPQNGDYPYIQGHQAIYYILNDNASVDTTLGVPPMGLEIHVMAFAFADTGVIYNTFFMHFDIINHSPNIYHDVLFGFLTDFDIGDCMDDYIGCDTTQNLYFGYNGDSIDGDGFGLTYGSHPPAVACVFLNRTMHSFMYYNNGSCDMCDPALGIEYYNYMQSRWKDGSHLVHHGDGHNPASTDTCNFVYPENSNWTEITEANTPYDRRGLASISIGNIINNSCITADLAYVWARDGVNPDPHSSVVELLSQIPNVVAFANQLALDSNCTYLHTDVKDKPLQKERYFNIYPNPAKDILTIKTNFTDYYVCLYSQLGQKVLEKQNATTINVDALRSGIYFIQLTNGIEAEWRKLIVE